jgi:hypothetical protein
MPHAPKQAVLLIHGIGEQRPMDTLRGFVKAVWMQDTSIHHKHAKAGMWSKPDTISGSFELRRLTTSKNRADVRTDFFEFYWAHLMEGTSAADVLAWARLLLLRWPWTVPKQLLGLWCLLVFLTVAVGLLALQTVLPDEWRLVEMPKWVTGMTGLCLAWGAMPVIKNIIGDAARYLNAVPRNIQRRQAIRTKGVKLLQKLHNAGYQRIIVVGHSLGSVIGYDILTYAWAMHNRSTDFTKDHPVMTDIEAKLDSYDPGSYQVAQRQLREELVKNGSTWRVTDFVTLGSPLTHAAILLARDAADLATKQDSRELPTCPPVLEKGKFSFPDDRVHRTPHHAAVFAPCRWTNLYFPVRYLIWGDVIGGPLNPLLGNGIRDVPVSTRLRHGFLSHTLYWTPENGAQAASHIVALRDALKMVDPTPAVGTGNARPNP